MNHRTQHTKPSSRRRYKRTSIMVIELIRADGGLDSIMLGTYSNKAEYAKCWGRRFRAIREKSQWPFRAHFDCYRVVSEDLMTGDRRIIAGE